MTTSHPTRRRPTGIRRPRVAGHTPHHGESSFSARRVPLSDTPEEAGTAAQAEAAADPATTAAERPTGRRPSGVRALRQRAARRRFRRPVPTPVLVGALVVLVGLAVSQASRTPTSAPPRPRRTPRSSTSDDRAGEHAGHGRAQDRLLVDYTRLDQNEAAARAVITPAFAGQFDQLFRQGARARAPAAGRRHRHRQPRRRAVDQRRHRHAAGLPRPAGDPRPGGRRPTAAGRRGPPHGDRAAGGRHLEDRGRRPAVIAATGAPRPRGGRPRTARCDHGGWRRMRPTERVR